MTGLTQFVYDCTIKSVLIVILYTTGPAYAVKGGHIALPVEIFSGYKAVLSTEQCFHAML